MAMNSNPITATNTSSGSNAAMQANHGQRGPNHTRHPTAYNNNENKNTF